MPDVLVGSELREYTVTQMRRCEVHVVPIENTTYITLDCGIERKVWQEPYWPEQRPACVTPSVLARLAIGQVVSMTELPCYLRALAEHLEQASSTRHER